jgi:hypothetical protein
MSELARTEGNLEAVAAEVQEYTIDPKEAY